MYKHSCFNSTNSRHHRLLFLKFGNYGKKERYPTKFIGMNLTPLMVAGVNTFTDNFSTMKVLYKNILRPTENVSGYFSGFHRRLFSSGYFKFNGAINCIPKIDTFRLRSMSTSTEKAFTPSSLLFCEKFHYTL